MSLTKSAGLEHAKLQWDFFLVSEVLSEHYGKKKSRTRILDDKDDLECHLIINKKVF